MHDIIKLGRVQFKIMDINIKDLAKDKRRKKWKEFKQ
jgi:hypothetical protein